MYIIGLRPKPKTGRHPRRVTLSRESVLVDDEVNFDHNGTKE